MLRTIWAVLASFARLFLARGSLLLENLALRQQLAVLKRRRSRPRLRFADRMFWLLARRFWSGWKQALIIVTPETVARWHRAGFQIYWRWSLPRFAGFVDSGMPPVYEAPKKVGPACPESNDSEALTTYFWAGENPTVPAGSPNGVFGQAEVFGQPQSGQGRSLAL
jgi:hypothetical protein